MIIDDLYRVAMLSAAWIIIFEYLNPLYAFVYAIGMLVIVAYILMTNFVELSGDSWKLLGDWR